MAEPSAAELENFEQELMMEEQDELAIEGQKMAGGVAVLLADRES